jgi:Na+/melibiose symporter-like transporter
MASWGFKVGGGAVSLVPLVGYALHHSTTLDMHILWPPIGSIETFASGVAAALIAVFGMLPALLRRESCQKWWLGLGVVIAIISVIAYAYFLSTYVKEVDTPNDGPQYRTVGSVRTGKAKQMFTDRSDGQILKIAGLTDGDIENMWTPSSVRDARIKLFFSYLFVLGAINFVLGSLARLKAKKNVSGSKDPSAV